MPSVTGQHWNTSAHSITMQASASDTRETVVILIRCIVQASPVFYVPVAALSVNSSCSICR